MSDPWLWGCWAGPILIVGAIVASAFSHTELEPTSWVETCALNRPLVGCLKDHTTLRDAGLLP